MAWSGAAHLRTKAIALDDLYRDPRAGESFNGRCCGKFAKNDVAPSNRFIFRGGRQRDSHDRTNRSLSGLYDYELCYPFTLGETIFERSTSMTWTTFITTTSAGTT